MYYVQALMNTNHVKLHKAIHKSYIEKKLYTKAFHKASAAPC